MPKVTMPQLGESVAEGTIGKWLKQVGDHVEKYEPIVEVTTDKVNAEVPSPFAGVLREILVKEGETVPNNTEIAVIEAVGETVEAGAAAEPPAAPAASAPAAPGDHGADATPETGATPAGGRNGAARAESGPERTIFGSDGHGPAGSDERPERPERPGPAASAAAPASLAEFEGRMTPAVRRIAREHGVDLALVTGTGHGGRITRDDVMAFVASGGGPTAAAARPAAAGEAAAAPPAPAAAAPPASAAPAAATAQPSGAAVHDELKAQTPMRKAIAAHMVRAKQTAPHAYTTVETDMSGVVALRDAVKASYQAEHRIPLSFVALVGKAVVEALKAHPDLNAHWTEEGVLRRREINLGIAVAVDDGLIVPVIRNADQLSIHGLNLAIADFATRARANKLRLDDIQGGTFTLNNTGWFGSVASQPIINVPEVAILSMEAIVKRPVVIESPAGDAIAIRPMMNLCTSFDHRATDGAQVGRFVQDVRRWLESADTSTSVW